MHTVSLGENEKVLENGVQLWELSQDQRTVSLKYFKGPMLFCLVTVKK